MKSKRSVSIDGFRPNPSRPIQTANPVGKPGKASQPTLPVKSDRLRDMEPVKATRSDDYDLGELPVLSDLPDQEPKRNNQTVQSGKIRATEIAKKKPRSKKSPLKLIVRIILVLLVVGLVYGGFYAYKIFSASSKVLDGSWTGIFTAKPLKTDSNGRTNILVFGTAEDDEGGKHGGPNLTDSIMIISINKEEDDMAMLNLPRDLWIKHENPCSVGYQEKLNTVYMCGSDDGKDEKAGAEALMRKVTEITSLEMQYYVHLNFGGVIALVDAVDGVDVDVMGYGSVPRGVMPGSILDRNFDWKCNYKCYYVKYEPGVHHMDGEHALAFIRARNAPGVVGYGLPNSNYDREKNQQKVVNALLDKTLTVGTLTNYAKFSKIVDAVGDNVKTNVSSDEVRSVVDLASKINFKSGRSISLVGEGIYLIKSGTSVKNTSMEQPAAGLFEYSAIKAYISRELTDAGLSAENARIGVFNGSGEVGAAQKLADKLKETGLAVSQVGNAPAQCETSSDVVIYALGNTATDKPKTLAKIKKVSGGQVPSCSTSFDYDATLDFVVVINSIED